MKAPRDEIGHALIALKEKGYPVVVIDSDLASSTRTDQFQAVYPEAFFEMGIAEGSAMSFAVGQALEGFMPFYVNFAMHRLDPAAAGLLRQSQHQTRR